MNGNGNDVSKVEGQREKQIAVWWTPGALNAYMGWGGCAHVKHCEPVILKHNWIGKQCYPNLKKSKNRESEFGQWKVPLPCMILFCSWTISELWGPPGVVPENRTISKAWAPLGVAWISSPKMERKSIHFGPTVLLEEPCASTYPLSTTGQHWPQRKGEEGILVLWSISLADFVSEEACFHLRTKIQEPKCVNNIKISPASNMYAPRETAQNIAATAPSYI